MRKAGVKPSLERTVPPAKPYELLTLEEMQSSASGPYIFDLESYPNYFCAGFKSIPLQKYICFESSPSASIDINLLSFLIFRHLIIGFNSRSYDLPLLGHAIAGVPYWKLKEISDELIYNDERNYDINLAKVNHIDLIEVAPLDASLKLYAGRLHCERMQDLPYSDRQLLTIEEAANVRDYNLNDLDNTELLFNQLKPSLELRIALSTEYQQDLRSKSDAQVAEAVIIGELRKRGVKVKKPEIQVGKTFRFQRPPGLHFQTQQLQDVLNEVLSTDFVIGDNGSVDTPSNLSNLCINFGGNKYTIGNGGLHSAEKSLSYYSTDSELLVDRDVASYYPAILINQNLSPPQLPGFIEVFKLVTDRRLAAKKRMKLADARLAALAKTESESLKIVINGIIGKLSNQYSYVYYPEGNTQVTVSGQMFLLMFVEMLVIGGFNVVSANTDGVVTVVPKTRKTEFNDLCTLWEQQTNFITEETSYRSLHCRDVNNYIAIKTDGEIKLKGVYSLVGSALNSPLSKNPECYIISHAVQEYLTKGIDIESTIRDTIHPFGYYVTVRTVKGGAYWKGTYLGKAIRWYYSSIETGTINYVLSGNCVPKSECARPCMNMPTQRPDDLNYIYYIREAYDTLYDIGVLVRPGSEKLL